MIIIDTEIYSNYFLLSCLHVPTGKILHFESHNDSPLDVKAIMAIMSRNTTVSFNGLSFDLPIITAAVRGWDNTKLKNLCNAIIKSNLPAYKIVRDAGITVPAKWDHIDIIGVAPGQASLKIYGGRMHSKRLQDLPISPDATISADQTAELRAYCENDLQTTLELYRALEKQIDLRVSMSDKYGMDLRSKSDAQIAEEVIKSELTKRTNKKYYKPDVDADYSFRYQDPRIISFSTDQLKNVFTRLLETDFHIGSNGAVQMPEWLTAQPITIGGSEYQMGIGGLHSCEKSRTVTRLDDEILIDMDVASYYPSIILQQKLAPKSIGVPFLKVYQSLVTQRLAAKSSGDNVTADTLKIVVNSSFGKLGSKWSALYAPDLLIQTTMTGQLALLMLIESLELGGVSVISANTDGIVIHGKTSQEQVLEEICFNWMLDTSYALERTDYNVLASRDVNNYVAVKPDGTYKGKGVFASGGLSKNPDFSIVSRAVAEHVATGQNVEDTIRNCKDITQFLSVRRVTGGAIWRGELLGKAVRFYYSTEVGCEECIHYAKNSNKVPKSAGSRPLMNLPEKFPDDVDYSAYIGIAEKLKMDIGC